MHRTFLVIFQVFHDFQSMWETWLLNIAPHVGKEKNSTFISPMDPSPIALTSNCSFLPPEELLLNPWPHTIMLYPMKERKKVLP